MIRPDLFPVFIWERLSWFGEWIDGTTGDKAVPGHATTAGAITFTILGAVATAIFLNRKKLAPVSAWAKRHPWRTGALGLIALPFGLYAVTIILMSLTKYLTFASALATTVGVLVALDNNRRSHEREERRLARQEMAARTAFAHALAAIQTYAQEVISAVSVIRRTDRKERTTVMDETVWPQIPATASAAIKEMIASTENKMVAERCAHVQKWLQQISTATLSPENALFLEASLQLLLRSLILYVAATSLLPFARNQRDDIEPLEWDDLDFWMIGFDMETVEGFRKYLETAREYHETVYDYNHRLKNEDKW